MFEEYPKTRPPLPDEIAEIYSEYYKKNREGETPTSSMSQRMEGWLHRCVAADLDGASAAGELATLELGAGTLNQLEHEPSVGPYDIVEPFESLFAGSPFLSRIRHVYGDISEVPDDSRYDRITSVATLEHICDLPQVVARSGLLLTERGSFRAAIPNEGTFLWTLGWRLTTGLEFKLRHGLDYGELMRHEHVNTAAEIEAVLEHFFETVECKVFGLSRALALYRFYECSDPRVERCAEFLACE